MGAYYPHPSYYEAAGHPKYPGGHRAYYSEYMGEEYRYGPPMHPYSVVNPYEGSPSHLVPVGMPSPHMPYPHNLSVHKSSSKSKRPLDQVPRSAGRQSCHGAAGERARSSQLNPRQLNFNDAFVESDRNRISFEEHEGPQEEPHRDSSEKPESE